MLKKCVKCDKLPYVTLSHKNNKEFYSVACIEYSCDSHIVGIGKTKIKAINDWNNKNKKR